MRLISIVTDIQETSIIRQDRLHEPSAEDESPLRRIYTQPRKTKSGRTLKCETRNMRERNR